MFDNELLGTVYFGFHILLFPLHGAKGAGFVGRKKSEGVMGVEGRDWQKKQIVGSSSSVSPQIFYFDIVQS